MSNSSFWANDLDSGQHAVEDALAELKESRAVRRMWDRDFTLWKPDPTEISDRLGWLDLPETMKAELDSLNSFVQGVRDEGLTHVVLCGMGGSSLAPEVFRLTFGSTPGFPDLIVLDSTDPGAIANVDAQIDPAKTLFIISSKSGGTIEVMSFLAHFWEATGERGSQFCCVTDPDTSLAKLAAARGFRHAFINPPDIGGRYSALSLFGLVPAALIGMDVARLLAAAGREAEAAKADEDSNPSAWLGAYIGGLARAGRDKLTFLTSPGLSSFGLWVEQLLAESTGKEGRGIIPIGNETVGTPERYGTDRAFVVLRLEGDDNAELDAATEALRAVSPLVQSDLADRYEMGAEMYRWETATALAAVNLAIQPFDQPNVQESKDNTARVLAETREAGRVPSAPPEIVVQAADVESVASFLRSAQPGNYVALMAYITPTDETEQALQALRKTIRDRGRNATTLGFGPRFLHSTGQLHKGGPPSGVFLQFTYRIAKDIPVPGQTFTFEQLISAQALGDLQSLMARGLPALRVDLGENPTAALQRLNDALSTAAL